MFIIKPRGYGAAEQEQTVVDCALRNKTDAVVQQRWRKMGDQPRNHRHDRLADGDGDPAL
jgi:hypothetical protein